MHVAGSRRVSDNERERETLTMQRDADVNAIGRCMRVLPDALILCAPKTPIAR
jgi:hypothetical protein